MAELDALLAELSKLVKTLEESETSRADADKTRADAEKTRADADKSRADADKVVADTEIVRSTARVDLESKEIANAKAIADNQAARIDKLISQATGAVPDISSLSKNTVSFSQGTVLRQGEAVAVALNLLATDLSDALKKAIEVIPAEPGETPVVSQDPPITELYIVSNPNLLADMVTYRRIKVEADALAAQVATAKTDADTALEPLGGVHQHDFGPPGTSLVLASLAGAVAKQVASLFELDVAVTTNATDVTAPSIHAAVAGALRAKLPALKVRHEFARVPPQDSALLAVIGSLIEGDIELARYDAQLDYAIHEMADPAKDLAEAQKRIQDPKTTPDDKTAAEADRDSAANRSAKLEELAGAKAGLTAVVAKTRAFSERITAAPASNGVSVLASAIAVEAINTADPGQGVLVVGPGKVESSQLVVARRIFNPRLQVSVALSVDYFLVQGVSLRDAGRVNRSVSYMGVVKSDGVQWKQAQALIAT